MTIKTISMPGDRTPQSSALADGLLLERFLQRGDQQAFSTLMDRHGPYLLGVCRRLTNYAHDAEDVFQACFLELVKKGAAIRERGSVAGWLQTVAVRLSRKARTQRAVRERQEAASAKPEAVSEDDLSWREVRRILEEELAQLPEDLRSPIVLCFFEGKTQEEAAAALAMNPRTLKDRLQRGRELLGKRLVRRGVTLAVLGTLLAGGTVQSAVSTALTQGTLHGATALAKQASLVAVVSPTVLSLTSSASWLSSWSGITAICIAFLLSGSASWMIWNRLAPTSRKSGEESLRAMRTVSRSFRGKQFDSSFFRWSGPKPQKYIQREEEGLRITLPSENGPGQPIGVQLRRPVRGDFDLEVGLEFLNVIPPPKGFGAGVTVYFYLDSPESDGIWFGKMNSSKRGPVFSVGHRLTRDQQRIDSFVRTIPASSESGFARLRVLRRGATFSIFGANGIAGEFQHLGDFEISDADLKIVRFAADPAWSTSAVVDARLIDFTMSAEEFVGYEP